MTLTRRAFNKAGLGLATALAVGGGTAVAGPGEMTRRAIPSSGELIPVIGLGTNRYGVDASPEARAPLRVALQRFAEMGGTVIDTAPMYRTSESVLGDLIADLGIRDKLFIATKADRDAGAEATDAQMRDSQRKLRTETFDLMQVHNLLGWREALAVMRDWKAEGRIRYIGITTSREGQYGEFEQVMRQEELDFVQLNYSVEQRASAERLMPLAKDRGMAVMINRGFGGGRIFKAVGDRPVPDWAREFDCDSWAQLLLKYALSHPAATVAIPGMTKVHHVEDNMLAGHGRMPDAAERRKIEAFYDAL
ncbi:MAG TPA: aldo/keto reductase [Woeseiaceae bacterium]|jgi:aryl-alcohol dehydrogenase-like predicted oxidoreductase|nr:aldo/keto reductase [Woeseiaceae bacterium]